MTHAILWLLTVEALGLLALPFAYALLPALKDRGFGFAKPLGMLMLAYPVWLLGSAQVPLGPRATAAFVFAAMAVAAAVIARRLWPELVSFVRREWRLLLATEAVFLAVFALWALMRAGMPGIGHTEQPMDFAFLNASMIASNFPPMDPWLSGHGISYYYFGYLTMGLPGVLAGIPSGVVYNLALALLPAMAAMGAVSLVCAVALRMGARLSSAFGLGLLGALMLGFLGNLEGVFEMLHAWGGGSEGFWQAVGIKGLDAPGAGASFFPSDHWWWWRSSRVIDTVVAGVSLDPTIHEYPFFSWFLGDLHPHVMSIPFVLLFVAFCFTLLADDTPLGLEWWRRRWPLVMATGLSLGALGFINAWDLPVFFAIGAGAAVLRANRASREGKGGGAAWAAIVALALLLLAVVPYLALLRRFHRRAGQGHCRRYDAGQLPAALRHRLGRLRRSRCCRRAPAPLASAGRAGHRPARGRRNRAGTCAVRVVAGHRASHGRDGAPCGPTVGRAAALAGSVRPLAGALRAPAGVDGVSLAFTMGIAAMGIALVMGPELFYVVDSFDNRMNTVFKLYYQAWAILAVAAPLTLYFGVRSALQGGLWVRRAGVALGFGFAALVLGAFYLPAGLAVTVSTTSGNPFTLDATAFLREQEPGEYAAIEWLRANAEAEDVIVEAVGGDYSTFGRVASFTGLPSPLNWPGHELQWRGSSEPQTGRAEDVEALYEAADPRRRGGHRALRRSIRGARQAREGHLQRGDTRPPLADALACVLP